eukprot:m.186887 g.186887  ORF g.186887 m.186887 type:complete len:108 (+) comp18494_c0_seq1:1961-2284(+)
MTSALLEEAVDRGLSQLTSLCINSNTNSSSSNVPSNSTVVVHRHNTPRPRSRVVSSLRDNSSSCSLVLAPDTAYRTLPPKGTSPSRVRARGPHCSPFLELDIKIVFI